MLLRQDSLAPMSSFLMRSTPALVWQTARPMGRTLCVPSQFMETSTKEETTKQEKCSPRPIQVCGCYCLTFKTCTEKNEQY